MMNFFKNLFSKDESPKRDVIVLEGAAALHEKDDEEKEEACAPRRCGGCGCR